jgi:hypothetical protein
MTIASSFTFTWNILDVSGSALVVPETMVFVYTCAHYTSTNHQRAIY